jgi:hypothetical protein
MQQAPVARSWCHRGMIWRPSLTRRQSIGGLLQRLTLLCGVSGGGAKLRFRALFPALRKSMPLKRLHGSACWAGVGMTFERLQEALNGVAD